MSDCSGEVQFVSKSQKGFHSLKIDDVWYGYGMYAPKCEKGSTVSFSYETKGDFNIIDSKSFKVAEGAVSKPVVKSGGAAGTRDKYWEDKAETDKVQQRIRETHAARSQAIETVGALVDAGAVKLPVKESGRYDALMALVDELTNRYFEDITERFYSGDINVIDHSKQEED